jgi:hypothetical protein
MDFKKYEKQIQTLSMDSQQAIEDVKDDALTEFSKHLKASGKLKLLDDALVKLESSRDLTRVENDHEFFHQYIRFDFSDIIDTDSDLQRELLVSFLEQNDFFMEPDFKNDCLTMNIGPCIVIDQDSGDVYDQDTGKIVLKGYNPRTGEADYETESERNEKIEKYMEKTGCFPSVVLVDRYGSPIQYVNIKEGAQ